MSSKQHNSSMFRKCFSPPFLHLASTYQRTRSVHHPWILNKTSLLSTPMEIYPSASAKQSSPIPKYRTPAQRHGVGLHIAMNLAENRNVEILKITYSEVLL